MEKTFIEAVRTATTPLLGCSVTITSMTSAKIIARAGFQWALIDMEHSPMNPELAANIVHAVVAASAGSCFPLIRIPTHSVEWIKWALDSGASGIIVPMVDTPNQMREILGHALYPPLGNRSWGPNNAVYASLDSTFSTDDYLRLAQDGGIAIIPMIESRTGLQNVEEILSIKGISAAFIGPQDLRMSMGLPSGRSGKEPEFEGAMMKIVETARKNGLPIGSIGFGGEVAKTRAKMGMSFLLCGLDRAGFTAGITEQLKNARNALAS